jgi:hypothetical protein
MTDAPMNLAAFTRRFAAADPAARTAFVADLWEAFGWETSTEGAVVVAERSTPVPESRRLLVPPGTPSPDGPDVDVIIMPGESVPTDAEVPTIGAADIRDRALYGADRSTTARVFRRHFDRELAVDPSRSDSDPSRPSETDPGRPPDESDADPGLDDEPDDDYGPDDGSGDDAFKHQGETSGDQEEASGDQEETSGDQEETSGDQEEMSDDGPVTARRVAGALVLAAFVVASVGLAAGVGLLPPEVVPGDGPVATPTDAGSTGVDVASNGSASRYASLRPTCKRPAGLVIKLQLDALGRNGKLGNDAGIRIAYRFASPANKRATGPGESFVQLIQRRYAIMLRYDSVRYGPLRPEERAGNGSRTLTQRVTLTDDNGTESAFMWSVTKQEDGRYDGCWLTSSVVAAPDEPPPDPDRSGVDHSGDPVRRVHD